LDPPGQTVWPLRLPERRRTSAGRGLGFNHKKVERIWREEGLQLPHRHKRRKRLYHHDASIIRLRPQYPNHIWSIDFVHDRLSNGRSCKMLTVLDEYTREALCVNVATRMGSVRRGKPDYLRCDNGPEFSSAPIQFVPWRIRQNKARQRPSRKTKAARMYFSLLTP